MTDTEFEAAVERAQRTVDEAFRDVEADNPDVECGWESDVARSVLHGEPEEVVREIMRRLFGLDEDEDDGYAW